MRGLAILLLLTCLSGCLVEERDGTTSPGDETGDAAPGTVASTSSSPPVPQPPQPPQPDTLFAHVRRSFTLERTSGSSSGPSFYGGHHCGAASYTLDPLQVTLHDWRPETSGTSGPSGTTGPTGSSGTTTSGPPADPWGPGGILFTAWDVANITGSHATIGYGPSVSGFGTDGAKASLPSAFPYGTVANLTAQGGEVRVDGHLLEAGVAHTVRVAYDHTTSGSEPSTFHVQERLDFTLHGLARVTSRVMGSYCI